MSVNSIGPHGTAGYQALIETMPILAHQSRRGLGLGRVKSRSKARVAYVQGVLKEQRRQWKEAVKLNQSWTFPSFDEENIEELRQLQTNSELLGSVAQRLAEKDQKYAAHLAKMYYENDLIDDARDKALREQEDAKLSPRESGVGTINLCHRKSLELWAPSEGLGETLRPRGDVEFLLNDIKLKATTVTMSSSASPDDVCLSPPSPYPLLRATSSPPLIRQISPLLCTKGYGISTDKLRQVGLSPNGHTLLKPKLQQKTLDQGYDASEDGRSDGESDADTLDSDSQREMLAM